MFKVISTLILIMFATPAFAGSWYVSAGAGGLVPSFDLPAGITQDTAPALNGRFGRKDYFGSSGWSYSEEIMIESTINGGHDIYVTAFPFLRAEVDTLSAMVNFKLETPGIMSMGPAGYVSLYVLGGIGLLHADGAVFLGPFSVAGSETEFAGRVGGGVHFGLGGGPLSFTVEAAHVMPADTLNRLDATSVTANLMWMF